MKFMRRIDFSKFIGNKKIIFLFMAVALSVALLSRMVYLSYTDYRDTIVAQQQEQLLTIAKSIARSLELYIEEKTNSLKMIANNPTFQKQLDLLLTNHILESDIYPLKAFYEAQNEEIETISLLDSKGAAIYRYVSDKNSHKADVSTNHPDVDYVLREHKPYVGNVYKNSAGYFVINILEPVFYQEQFRGILMISIDLNVVYNRLVQPVRAGEKGYVMVKDNEGTILMHPAEEQIGIHVLKTRKERYPDLDFSELEGLINNQMKGKEGAEVYHSYWWPDNKLVKVKKLNAYAPANVGNDFWIVAVPMSYKEIADPIQENLFSILRIVFIFILMFSGSIFVIVRMQKNKKALEIETRYLKELNKATEELRRSEAQLQHSQKLQTIGTLTGGIAHEFNNLLTPILGYSEIILRDLPRESELYEDITEIYDTSKKAKELIEQILIFSRRENKTLQYKPVQINQLIKGTLKLVRSALPSTIDIVENTGEDCGYVWASPTQIHQVIINLCTNAYHAMKERGGILEIHTQVVSREKEVILKNSNLSDGAYIKISVKDTGCGMTKEMMNQIFDPFFTTKAVGEGTGLGLSVVHGIISNHKGEIVVESEWGVGSIFNVYLPQMEAASDDVSFSDHVILKGNETILIVDDEPKVVKMMKKKLEQLGYRVCAETNSVEALKNFRTHSHKFDLIMTDQAMPHLKGIELAEKMKEIRPDIKILLITGFIDETVTKYIENAVIDDYLIKPILTTELSEKIRKVLMRSLR